MVNFRRDRREAVFPGILAPVGYLLSCYPFVLVTDDCRIKRGDHNGDYTKAECFCGPFTWRYLSRKQWDIAIAGHADRGRVVLSMPLRFEA